MWSTHKRRSGSQRGHDKRDIPTLDMVSLHSILGNPRRNYSSIITTDINVLHLGSITSKRLLKIRQWWLKNKERKVDFRFVERKFLAAINLTGSAEGALVPVLLRITHWTKSGLPVSLPGLFPPWLDSPSPPGMLATFVELLLRATRKTCTDKHAATTQVRITPDTM